MIVVSAPQLMVIADPYVAAARYLGVSTSGSVVDINGNVINMMSTSVATSYNGWTQYTYTISGIFYLSSPTTIVRINFNFNGRPVVVMTGLAISLNAGYHMFVVQASITSQTATLGT